MAASSYDAIAAWYDEDIHAGWLRDDPFYPAVAARTGSATGRRLDDVGRGQSRVVPHLAARRSGSRHWPVRHAAGDDCPSR